MTGRHRSPRPGGAAPVPDARVSAPALALAQVAAFVPPLLFLKLLARGSSGFPALLAIGLAAVAVVPAAARGRGWAKGVLAAVNGGLLAGLVWFLLRPEPFLVVSQLLRSYLFIVLGVLLYAVLPVTVLTLAWMAGRD